MKDALGHGSDALGQRMHQVIARGQNGAQRAAAQEWMGNGITRKVGSEIMYDRAMAAAKQRDMDDEAMKDLHSGTPKSDLAPLTTAELADLKTRLRARGFASVKKD